MPPQYLIILSLHRGVAFHHTKVCAACDQLRVQSDDVASGVGDRTCAHRRMPHAYAATGEPFGWALPRHYVIDLQIEAIATRTSASYSAQRRVDYRDDHYPRVYSRPKKEPGSRPNWQTVYDTRLSRARLAGTQVRELCNNVSSTQGGRQFS